MSWNPKFAGESNFKEKKHFDLSDGDVVAAILPQPKGNNTEYDSRWSQYHSVQWGYKNSEGKHRPFESPLVKNNKTKEVEVRDAALDRINDLKAKLDQAKSEGNTALAAKLNALVGQKGIYNVDNNHHMNVVLLDGTIGELKIRYKAKLELDRELARLRSEGANPLSFEDGRLFVFSRSGRGSDTSFKVTAYTQKVTLENGRTANAEVSHQVTPQMLARLETEGFNLDNLFQQPTAEEVAQIVAESDLMTGKSPACDRIFDARWKADREAKKGTTTQTVPAALPVPNKTAPTTASAAQTTTVTGPALPAGSLQSTNEFTQAPAQKQTQAQPVDEMSDEDFFKQIGVPQGA